MGNAFFVFAAASLAPGQILAIVFLVCGILCLPLAWYYRRRYKILGQSCTETADGLVELLSVQAIVHFSVQGEEHTVSFLNNDQRHRYRPGEEVQVHYNPDDLKQFYLSHPGSTTSQPDAFKKTSTLLYVCGGAFLLVALLLAFL